MHYEFPWKQLLYLLNCRGYVLVQTFIPFFLFTKTKNHLELDNCMYQEYQSNIFVK